MDKPLTEQFQILLSQKVEVTQVVYLLIILW